MILSLSTWGGHAGFIPLPLRVFAITTNILRPATHHENTQGTATKNGRVVATVRRRVHSFSHLPRPRLSREEFIRYLGDRVTAGNARDSDPAGSGVVGDASLEEGVDGAKKNDGIGKDGAPRVSDAIVMDDGEAELEGGVVGSDELNSAVMPRKRQLRPWPSSADIGMITDGR